jgi:hypothetical protein
MVEILVERLVRRLVRRLAKVAAVTPSRLLLALMTGMLAVAELAGASVERGPKNRDLSGTGRSRAIAATIPATGSTGSTMAST